MKVTVKHWQAVAFWRWDLGRAEQDDVDGEEDVCGICRVPYESCCPSCKTPGEDCPLSKPQPPPSLALLFHVFTPFKPVWGECTHVFHMHCLLKWIGTPASKGQCPMDRRSWGTRHLISCDSNPPIR